jgi:hypothetical protein
MGFLRTVTSIAKELGRTPFHSPRGYMEGMRETNPMAKELFQLLEGATKIPKKEFGRYNRFMFDSDLGSTVGGSYSANVNRISLNPNYSVDNKLQDFLHELTHARQYNPNASERDHMVRLIAASKNTASYADEPIEMAARGTAKLALPQPGTFSKNFDYVRTDPVINMKTDEGIIKLLNRYANEPGPESRFIEHYGQNVKPYSGKGWFWGGASLVPFFAQEQEQTGR